MSSDFKSVLEVRTEVRDPPTLTSVVFCVLICAVVMKGFNLYHFIEFKASEKQTGGILSAISVHLLPKLQLQ